MSHEKEICTFLNDTWPLDHVILCIRYITREKRFGYPVTVSEDEKKIYCHTHNLLQVPIAELAERWTELPQVSDESRSFFRVHTGYFSNIPKCIKAEFIASWACSQSSVVSSSQR
ncbi:hypothetical protein TNCV_168631 [Trichonephila clavipes]|nr:hypothetical protein TNCV_168631 [Trichonephila clavipes]